MRYLAIATAAVIAGACPVFAEDNIDRSLTAGGGADQTTLALPIIRPVFQAAYNSDEKISTITGTFKLSPRWRYFTALEYLSVTAQAPIAQGQNYANTATLDGLTKATSLSLKYVFKKGGTAWGSQVANFESNDSLCWRLVDSTPDSYLKPASQQPHEGLCDETVIYARLTKLKAANQADIASGKLSSSQMQDALRMESAIAEELTQYKISTSPNPQDLLEFAVGAKVGYEQHVYYDPASLAKNTSNATPWQAGFTLGYVPKSLQVSFPVSFNGGFNYQHAYLDANMGTTQTKCISSGATCVNGFIGAPTLQDKGLLSVDVRWVPKIGDFSIGIDPGYTHDVINGSDAFQFPVYFVSDSTGNLTGGIRYDWTSTTHVSTVGLFVSSAFSIFQ